MVDKKRKRERLISNQTKVAINITNHLFSSLSKDESNKNIVFSPVSIYVALSMVAAGSNGPTRDEMLSFLNSKSTDHLSSLASHLASSVLYSADDATDTNSDSDSDSDSSNDDAADTDPVSVLHFINGLWIDQSYPLKPSFESLIRNDYKAAMASVDFQTKAEEVRKEVNSWAKKETNGIIDHVLPPGSVAYSTKLIFANALHFKAVWEECFSRHLPKDFDFHLLNNTSVKVPFLIKNRIKDRFVGVFDGFKVLRLPYETGGNDERRFSMYLFLPDAKDGLFALIEKAVSEPMFFEHNLPQQKVKVRKLRIPKFKFSFEIDLSKVLKEMGLVLPFSEEDADFSDMVYHNENENTYISGIFHKSFIDVNEKGTEAAAITPIVARRYTMCGRPSPSEKAIDFVADHPFLFLIREDVSKTVLFLGLMLNPLITF